MSSNRSHSYRYGRLLSLAIVALLTGCDSGDAAKSTTAKPTNEPTSSETARDITGIPGFAPLETGTYYIDPDNDPSTPLRVVYEISADGWSQWGGAVKFVEGSGDGHVGVSITTVTDLVSHGCRDHSPADPPVGPTVNDLAAGLADLAPFRVTSPPTDITMYGYGGKHLELTVPDLPVERSGDGLSFSECDGGNLNSWIAPYLDKFYGHTGPGYTEEFWILDVEGSRLVIVAHRSPGVPSEDIAELRAVLNSIRIEP
ncbi:MAG: hypothetical protein GEU90_15820 [Gemmatimonas sp.]|nr:hypothetical protein [Gemmatimonas sp.]